MSLDLPHVIATLNATSLLLLLCGFFAVKSNRLVFHKFFMLAATVSSILFLFFYLTHHYSVGSVPYPHHDWRRILYFIILVPHIILAGLMLPFIIMAIRTAMKNEIEKHKKIVRFLFPVWVYVSVTGLIVYLMLY